ncbi:MAG: hypothetical protein ACFHX7_19775 [Pseudomonadota bacterium]
MRQIINYFWLLCTLRQGPDQLPANGFVLGICLLCYCLAAIITLAGTAGNLGFGQVLASITSGVAVTLAMVFGLLALKGLQARLPQTMGAMFGANTVMLVISLPFNLVRPTFMETDAQIFIDLAILGTFAWWLTIAGFIAHRAANISLIQGMAFALATELLSLTINGYVMSLTR